MRTISYKLFAALFLMLWISACGKSNSSTGTDEPDSDPSLPKVSITVDKAIKYQTIEGFGFFGAADVWWNSESGLWNDAWAQKAIGDLGITMWRNEIYPTSTPNSPQDASWDKQKGVVKKLKEMATQFNTELRMIATVWSPPENMKWEAQMSWAGDENATRNPGNVSTKNGGTLNPNMYNEYADYLNSHIKLYADLGINLYAISLQNELMFKQTFNSCIYTSVWYNDLLTNVVPRIKSVYPNIKIFGSENMLEMEGKDENWQWFYHNALKKNSQAAANIDVLAVHGYSDGVAASSGSALAKMWTNHYEQLAKPMNKVSWMTETSGYVDDWQKTNNKPGALNLAMDIHSALFYGNISAWVWWQGSQADVLGEFNLMKGTTVGKRYYASKHFYRYIRPGAVRVKSVSDSEELFVTAFENSKKTSHTIVIINTSSDKSLTISGSDLPVTFKMFRTNATDENCKFISEIKINSAFVIPANTIITLLAGNDTL